MMTSVTMQEDGLMHMTKGRYSVCWTEKKSHRALGFQVPIDPMTFKKDYLKWKAFSSACNLGR